jgi:hypothetical protein
VAGRDITEGDGNVWALAPDGLPIARGTADIGIVSTDAIWQNTNISYDFALGGMPFISAVTDKNEYLRETAPFRKDQFDNGQEPGEQSLTGWWLRSQMSFHGGAGINFYDPLTNDESGQYRFNDSQGVDVWTKGEVKLLKEVVNNHITTGAITGTDHQHPNQHVRSIQYNGTNAVLLHDEFDVDKIVPGADPVHFIDYISGTDRKVFAICDDGVNAYWVTNKTVGGNQRLTMFKKPLTGDSTTGSSNPSAIGDVTQMFQSGDTEIIYATMEFIKDRIVLCVNNRVYELPTSATSLPSPIYTNPNTNYHYTSVAASGPAIYTAGHSGIYSTIQKYTLSTAGAMPTLTSAVVAAELPAGEIIEKIYYYLGYMCIGTSKGIRVALVNDQDGSLTYGPLIVETEQPVYDFAGRDHFVWAASGIGAIDAGLIRIDLENEISTLRMAYANDLQVTQTTEHYTTGVAFIGTTNRLAFCTAHNTTNGAIYTESASTLRETGYITTGNIRFGTLEPKNFKRLVGRGDFSKGMLTLSSVDNSITPAVEYDHITYDSVVSSIEVATSQPSKAAEYLAYKFLFRRDITDTSTGPLFKGYQAKATIATPRQRLIQFPVYCYDVETDRNGVQVGYEDRAQERLLQLEAVEDPGDIILWQDLNTRELRQVQIEKIRFTKATPPSGRFSGSGGIIEIVVRTV